MQHVRYLLLGGGTACAHAAQSIRERDAEGEVLIVGAENHPPYDRPPLSKSNLLRDDLSPDDFDSKDGDFYTEERIQLILGATAERIEPDERRVVIENGETLRYEKLLLATGSRPVKLNLPGSRLPGVLYLRTIEDSTAIHAAITKSRKAAIIGAGYIGMEVAAACAERGLDVTVIDPGPHPWPRFASPALGGFVRETFAARGVSFLFGRSVDAFTGDGALRGVTLDDGQKLDADFAVVGVGAALNTGLASRAGLSLGNSGGVEVDEYLRTSDPNIWAAGDIAYFADIALDKKWHVEHFLNARWQGQAAGAVMAGEHKPYDRVAYFYSDILDIHMIHRGDGQPGGESVILGDLPAAEFVELHSDQRGRLRAGIAFSHEEKKLDPIADKLEELLRVRADVRGLAASAFGL